MLVLLSPAKNLDFAPHDGAPPATKPALTKETAELVAAARALSAADIRRLMSVSEKLAELNRARFADFKTSGRIEGAKPAALAFNGDVYQGLAAKSFSADDFAFAQEHLRILSGLYGLLRPLDAIQPYRLEMGARLKTARGPDLYAFWGDRLAREINRILAGHDDPTIVNLASQEYFGAVDAASLKAKVVTALFKEEKDGALRQLQFFQKRARGAMARWIVKNRVTRAADLARFAEDGYRLRKDLSDESTMIFTRPQPPLKAAARKRDD